MNEEPLVDPTPTDYGEAKTRQVVISETIQHPATLMPIAAGVIGGAGVLMLTPLGAGVGVGIIVGGIAVGAVSWLANWKLRGDACALKYHEMLHKKSDETRRQKLAVLEGQLGSEADCEQGRAQVSQFEEKFNNLAEVLRRKLSSQELTYSRYLSTAESIYNSGIKNLEQVAVFLKGVSEINIADIRRKIAKLDRLERITPAQERELATIREREKIYSGTQEKVAELLAQNEESLTGLDKTAVAIAAIETSSRITGSTDQMDLAMEELRRLLARGEQSRITLS